MKNHLRLLTSVALVAASVSFAFAEEPNASGIKFERLEAKRGVIESRDLPVSDWKVRLTNESDSPKWLPTVSQKNPSDYLVERNPKQISYRVFVQNGERWTDSYMGWSTLIGPKDGNLKLDPGESIEFVVPIFDRFESNPAQVRLEIDILQEERGRKVERLVTEAFAHEAP